MQKASPFWLAIAYVAISVIWGSTYLAIKVGLESFDPLFYAGVRYLLAAPLMYLIARGQGVRFEGPLSRWMPAFAVGVLFITVANGLIFWAETRLDSGFTALLVTTSALWTALLSPLLAGERRLGMRGAAGVVIGFAGTVVLLAPWETGGVELAGALAVVLSALVWSSTALWVRRMRASYHPLALTTAQMASGAAALLLLAGLHGEVLVGPVSWRALAGLAFLVVFGSVVAFTAYFYLLRHVDAARVASSTYINPIVALALGALLLGEAITPRMILGTLIVLAGVALVLQRQHARDSLLE